MSPTAEGSRFRNPNVVPPGGYYFYTVPETGVELRHAHMLSLVLEIQAHYRANRLPPPEGRLEEKIQEQMCAMLPDGFCTQPNPRLPFYEKVLSATQAFAVFLRAGPVSPALAYRRAEICTRCPKNVPLGCGYLCRGLSAMVTGMLGRGRKTKWDPSLWLCQVCGCVLRAKVHVPLHGIRSADYPEHCWVARRDA